MEANILLVDDDANLRQVMEHNLSTSRYSVFPAESGEAALQILETRSIDLAIVDIQMEGMSGIELLEKVKQYDSSVIVIIITAYGSIELAVDSMKKGAYDFITKPFNTEEFKLIVTRALEYGNLRSENVRLRQELQEQFDIDGIVGKSKQIRDLKKMVGKLAATDSNILITGESGTGKELFAKAIHYGSDRKDKPFITINCAAIPKELLESELFGFEKGSFTGAHKLHQGKFEVADSGTIFLDEIGEMPPQLQVKILRALQEKEVDRIGSTAPVKVDVRIIAATNRDIREAVEEGDFREDLYYRISIIPVHIPPLRERLEDIPLLLEHSVLKYNCPELKFSQELYDFLINYGWPGNVRELENIVQRLIAFHGPDGTATIDEIPEFRMDRNKQIDILNIQIPEDGIILDDVERNILIAGLRKANWNQSGAAKLLGISRQTLIYRIQKYGIGNSDADER